MSASWGLVRFNKTGNIYMGCYEGTSDIFIPRICTPEECYDENFDCYCSISHCRELSRDEAARIFPDNVEDLDDVEIYSDYGGGSYWSGTGSESLKMLKTGVNPYEEGLDESDGMPDWVVKFCEEINADDD